MGGKEPKTRITMGGKEPKTRITKETYNKNYYRAGVGARNLKQELC